MQLTRWWDLFRKGGTYNSKQEILSKQDEKKLSKETFSSKSEIDFISPPEMSCINMVLNGSNVDTSNKKWISSALTSAQLLQFNTVK